MTFWRLGITFKFVSCCSFPVLTKALFFFKQQKALILFSWDKLPNIFSLFTFIQPPPLTRCCSEHLTCPPDCLAPLLSLAGQEFPNYLPGLQPTPGGGEGGHFTVTNGLSRIDLCYRSHYSYKSGPPNEKLFWPFIFVPIQINFEHRKHRIFGASGEETNRKIYCFSIQWFVGAVKILTADFFSVVLFCHLVLFLSSTPTCWVSLSNGL